MMEGGGCGMETGYLLVTVSAPASAEEVTFQCFVANTPAGAQRMRSRLQAIRERLGMFRITGPGGDCSAAQPSDSQGAPGGLQEGKP